jgi:hypothetical protein
VNIIKDTKTLTAINGLPASWYHVSFTHRGARKTGYIWGGLLSLASLPVTIGGKPAYILYGLSGYSKNSSFKSAAKLVQGSSILSQVSFDPIQMPAGEGPYSYSVRGTSYGSRGFEGIENIIILSFAYEACGYPNGDVLVILRGRKLFYGMETQSVAEAGIFHYTTILTFPDEKGGVKNRLLHTVDEEAFDEKANKYKLVKRTRKRFTWNGNKFVTIKK